MIQIRANVAIQSVWQTFKTFSQTRQALQKMNFRYSLLAFMGSYTD